MGKCKIRLGETPKQDGKKQIGWIYRYTEELGREICDAISTSSVSIKTVVDKARAEGKDWPDIKSVYYWRKEIPHFRNLYIEARKAQCENFVDDTISIADESENDINEKGQVNAEVVNRSKLRIQTRQWMYDKLFLERSRESEEDKDDKIAELKALVQVLAKEQEKDY